MVAQLIMPAPLAKMRSAGAQGKGSGTTAPRRAPEGTVRTRQHDALVAAPDLRAFLADVRWQLLCPATAWVPVSSPLTPVAGIPRFFETLHAPSYTKISLGASLPPSARVTKAADGRGIRGSMGQVLDDLVSGTRANVMGN